MRQTVSSKTVSKILGLETHPIPMSDAKNKLEILAVKAGLKPAFQDFRQVRSEINPDPLVLQQIARLLGLTFKSTPNPPLYFSRSPEVPRSFLNDYYIRKDFEAFWIYEAPDIEQRIAECVNGRLNEGYVLGYPECCIKWHEEMRVAEVESCYGGMESYVKATIDKQLIETWKRFSFAPHWACSACLSLRSPNTASIDRKYRELAANVGMKFEKDLKRKVRRLVGDLERSIASSPY